jgi:hypothetical protein
MNKKAYIKPNIIKVELDYTISIQMQSQPHDPPPRRGIGDDNNKNTPFKSPFGDKPFG